MIFGEPWGAKASRHLSTGEDKPRKNLTQETCPDRGTNPGSLRDRRACYHLSHSGGHVTWLREMRGLLPLAQAWSLGSSYSQSNQQETEQSTVHCVMLSTWSQCLCVPILSSCISILFYISGFQIVVRKRVTFRWYASSFQRNIWRRNKRYTVHTFSGSMRNIKV